MGIANKSKDKPTGAKAGGSGPRVNKVRSIIEQLEKSKKELNTHCEAVTTAITDLNTKRGSISTPPAKSPRPLGSRFATSTPKSSEPPTSPTTKTPKYLPQKKIVTPVKKGFAEVLPGPDDKEYQAEIINLTTTTESPIKAEPTVEKAEKESVPPPEPEPKPLDEPATKEKTPEETLVKPSKIPALKSRTPSIEKSKSESSKSSRSHSGDSTTAVPVKKSKSPSVEPSEVPQKSRSPSVAKSVSVEKEPEKVSLDPQKSKSPSPPGDVKKHKTPSPPVEVSNTKDSRSGSVVEEDRVSNSTSDDAQSIRKDSIPESEKVQSRAASRQASISTDISQTLSTTDIVVNLKLQTKDNEKLVEKPVEIQATGVSNEPTELDAQPIVENQKKSTEVNLQKLKKISSYESANGKYRIIFAHLNNGFVQIQ